MGVGNSGSGGRWEVKLLDLGRSLRDTPADEWPLVESCEAILARRMCALDLLGPSMRVSLQRRMK